MCRVRSGSDELYIGIEHPRRQRLSHAKRGDGDEIRRYERQNNTSQRSHSTTVSTETLIYYIVFLLVLILEMISNPSNNCPNLSSHPHRRLSALLGILVSRANNNDSNFPRFSLSIIPNLIRSLLSPSIPSPTYLVMFKIKFAYPLHEAIDSCALHLLLSALRTASMVDAAIS